MPPPTQAHLVERPWAAGETISFGAKVRAYGRCEKVTFGTNKEGWNRTRAELETKRIIQHTERGTWVPPRIEPPEDRLEPCPRSACGLTRASACSRTVVAVKATRPRRGHDQRLRVEARIPAAVLRPLEDRRDLPTARRSLRGPVREVEFALYLRDELLEYAMELRGRGLRHEPSEHFFGTSTGPRRDPDRFRDRILARAVERANTNREQHGLAPLPEITPHSRQASVCRRGGDLGAGWVLPGDRAAQRGRLRYGRLRV